MIKKILTYLNQNKVVFSILVLIIPAILTILVRGCREEWLKSVHATPIEKHISDSTHFANLYTEIIDLLESIDGKLTELTDDTELNENRLILLIKISAMNGDYYSSQQKERLRNQFGRGQVDPDSLLIYMNDTITTP